MGTSLGLPDPAYKMVCSLIKLKNIKYFMLIPLSLFTVLQLFCFSVSNKNEAGDVSVRVSTYI